MEWMNCRAGAPFRGFYDLDAAKVGAKVTLLETGLRRHMEALLELVHS